MSQFTLVETPIDDIKMGEEFLYHQEGANACWVSAILDEDPNDEDCLVFWTANGGLGELDELPDKLYLVKPNAS